MPFLLSLNVRLDYGPSSKDKPAHHTTYNALQLTDLLRFNLKSITTKRLCLLNKIFIYNAF